MTTPEITIETLHETDYDHDCGSYTITNTTEIPDECMECIKKGAYDESYIYCSTCDDRKTVVTRTRCICCELLKSELERLKSIIDCNLCSLGDRIKNGYFCDTRIIADLQSVTFEMRKIQTILNKK